MPYDHDHTENAEFRVREYANEFKSFSAKKRLSFPPNYIQRRGTVSSDYDHAAQVELHAQEYANESNGS